MEIGIDTLPDRGFALSSDQKLCEAESQLTFLRLKLQLLTKESEEKYDELQSRLDESELTVQSLVKINQTFQTELNDGLESYSPRSSSPKSAPLQSPRISELTNSLANLKWGFRRRENELLSQIAQYKAVAAQLHTSQSRLKNTLRSVCERMCDGLVRADTTVEEDLQDIEDSELREDLEITETKSLRKKVMQLETQNSELLLLTLDAKKIDELEEKELENANIAKNIKLEEENSILSLELRNAMTEIAEMKREAAEQAGEMTRMKNTTASEMVKSKVDIKVDSKMDSSRRASPSPKKDLLRKKLDKHEEDLRTLGQFEQKEKLKFLQKQLDNAQSSLKRSLLSMSEMSAEKDALDSELKRLKAKESELNEDRLKMVAISSEQERELKEKTQLVAMNEESCRLSAELTAGLKREMSVLQVDISTLKNILIEGEKEKINFSRVLSKSQDERNESDSKIFKLSEYVLILQTQIALLTSFVSSIEQMTEGKVGVFIGDLGRISETATNERILNSYYDNENIFRSNSESSCTDDREGEGEEEGCVRVEAGRPEDAFDLYDVYGVDKTDARTDIGGVSTEKSSIRAPGQLDEGFVTVENYENYEIKHSFEQTNEWHKAPVLGVERGKVSSLKKADKKDEAVRVVGAGVGGRVEKRPVTGRESKISPVRLFAGGRSGLKIVTTAPKIEEVSSHSRAHAPTGSARKIEETDGAAHPVLVLTPRKKTVISPESSEKTGDRRDSTDAPEQRVSLSDKNESRVGAVTDSIGLLDLKIELDKQLEKLNSQKLEYEEMNGVEGGGGGGEVNESAGNYNGSCSGSRDPKAGAGKGGRIGLQLDFHNLNNNESAYNKNGHSNGSSKTSQDTQTSPVSSALLKLPISPLKRIKELSYDEINEIYQQQMVQQMQLQLQQQNEYETNFQQKLLQDRKVLEDERNNLFRQIETQKKQSESQRVQVQQQREELACQTDDLNRVQKERKLIYEDLQHLNKLKLLMQSDLSELQSNLKSVTEGRERERDRDRSRSGPGSPDSFSSGYFGSNSQSNGASSASKDKQHIRQLVEALKIAKTAVEISHLDLNKTQEKMVEFMAEVEFLQSENRALKQGSQGLGQGRGQGQGGGQGRDRDQAVPAAAAAAHTSKKTALDTSSTSSSGRNFVEKNIQNASHARMANSHTNSNSSVSSRHKYH